MLGFIIAFLITAIAFLVSVTTGCWWYIIGTLTILALIGLGMMVFPHMAAPTAGGTTTRQRMTAWFTTHGGQLVRTILVITAIVITVIALGLLVKNLPSCGGIACGKTATTTSVAPSTGTAPMVAVPANKPAGEYTYRLRAGEQKFVDLPPARKFSLEQLSNDSMFVETSRGEVVATAAGECKSYGITTSVVIRLKEEGDVIVRIYPLDHKFDSPCG